MNQWKLTDLTVENFIFTGKSVKMKITDSISENLTDLDLESRHLCDSGGKNSAIWS